MLEDYIKNNPWIKNSELYKSCKYKDYKPETVRKIDLNNLKLEKLIKFLDFWKLDEPYPIQIYIFIDALSEGKKESFLDSSVIKNSHMKELINLGINESDKFVYHHQK